MKGNEPEERYTDEECASLFAVLFPNGFAGEDERPKEPEPTLEEVAAAYQDSPIETEREVRELVGMCLWDTFSNEHDVVGLDGRLVDIGSWRGAGGFIAEQLNRQTAESKYDYMDFYMALSFSGIGAGRVLL